MQKWWSCRTGIGPHLGLVVIRKPIPVCIRRIWFGEIFSFQNVGSVASTKVVPTSIRRVGYKIIFPRASIGLTSVPKIVAPWFPGYPLPGTLGLGVAPTQPGIGRPDCLHFVFLFQTGDSGKITSTTFRICLGGRPGKGTINLLVGMVARDFLEIRQAIAIGIRWCTIGIKQTFLSITETIRVRICNHCIV